MKKVVLITIILFFIITLGAIVGFFLNRRGEPNKEFQRVCIAPKFVQGFTKESEVIAQLGTPLRVRLDENGRVRILYYGAEGVMGMCSYTFRDGLYENNLIIGPPSK